jgi:hypothetical protein
VARFFRFVEKKRGQRRTGSNLVGSLGEAVFCGSLFLLGTLLLSIILGAYLARPTPEQFAIGVGGWLLILITSSSVILGGGGLIWTVLRVGTSAERRSAMATHAAGIDLVQQTVPSPRNYPTLPACEGLTNSPGIELAYRLPPSQSPVWRLLAMAIFAMLWNIVICPLTVSIIGGHVAGRHDWLLTLLLIPFWLVSFWTIREFLRLFVLHTGLGTTTVEISDLPLVPGREYQVSIAQNGHVNMKLLQVALVCEEEATYHQGTDIRSEVREVYRQPCFERRNFRIEPAAPFSDSFTIAVPAAAMHSFHSQHNVVRWKLVVLGEAEAWPAFERGFPLVVYPGQGTMRGQRAAPVALGKVTAFPAPATIPSGLTPGVRA